MYVFPEGNRASFLSQPTTLVSVQVVGVGDGVAVRVAAPSQHRWQVRSVVAVEMPCEGIADHADRDRVDLRPAGRVDAEDACYGRRCLPAPVEAADDAALPVGEGDDGGSHPPGEVGVFGGAFVLSLVAAAVFAVFLGPAPALASSVCAGVAVGLGWVATSFGINYLFAGRSLKRWLVDGGYHTLQFTLYGLVLGLWH